MSCASTTHENDAEGKIVADPVTGLPVLSAGKKAHVLTCREVANILTESTQEEGPPEGGLYFRNCNGYFAVME